MCHKAKNLLLWWRFTVFLTTTADSSHSFRMIFYRSQSFRALARTLCEKDRKRNGDTERRIYYLEWQLTVFLTTTADSSHSFSLTFYRSQSFRALARIPCEKGGNQQCVIKRRIYYSDDVLLFSSPQRQILHIRSVWRLAFSVIMAFSVIVALSANRHSERR